MSVLWTLGPEARTLRWAAVTLGLAGVLAGSAVAAREAEGRMALARGLGAIAFAAGLWGLIAWAVHDYPYALKLSGEWRPAGPFEYPPTLALLMVSALPIYFDALRNHRLLGGAGIAVAGAVLVLSGSRTGLAMGVAVVGLALWRGRPLVLAAFVAAALAAGLLAFGTEGSFLHGRSDTWGAGLDTFADRPFHGTGADAFLAGSARHQGGAAISFAHNLPLEFAAELGLLGLALALALYGFSLRLTWLARASRAGWLFGPAVLAFLVSSLLDWPWHLAGSAAVWALAAGALSGCLSNLACPNSTQGDP